MDLLSALSAQQPSDNQPEENQLICSRKACRKAATHKILWNNPKIHTPDRRKVWLGCDEHTQWLEQYLSDRLLYKSTEPIDPHTQGATR